MNPMKVARKHEMPSGPFSRGFFYFVGRLFRFKNDGIHMVVLLAINYRVPAHLSVGIKNNCIHCLNRELGVHFAIGMSISRNGVHFAI